MPQTHHRAGSPVFPNDTKNLTRHLLTLRANARDHAERHRLLRTLIYKYADAQQKIARLNQERSLRLAQLDEDLKAAAEIQRRLLPRSLPDIPGMEVAFQFAPSDYIGGDIFDVMVLDPAHVAIYMIDVSGHGVPAALISAAVSEVLRRHAGMLITPPLKKSGPPRIIPPAEVLTHLDREFPIERFDKFFTMIYMIVNIETRTLTYTNAGHPPPLLLKYGQPPLLLTTGGTIVGSGLMPFNDETIHLAAGDRLLLYTDGILEHADPDGVFFGQEGLHDQIMRTRHQPVARMVSDLLDALRRHGDGPFVDDVSILGIEILP